MGRYKQYTVAQRKRAIEMYQAGWSSGQIRKMVGVGEQTVRNWLREEGIPRRRGGPGIGLHHGAPNGTALSANEIEQRVKLYESGLTIREVAALLNRDSSSIRCSLLRAGVKLRTNSEAKKLSYQRKPHLREMIGEKRKRAHAAKKN